MVSNAQSIDGILPNIHVTGIYLLALIGSFLRSPKLDERQLDGDAENAEEEALLARSRSNAGAQWQNVIGRANRRNDIRREED